jgi:RHS repeat-associated protein
MDGTGLQYNRARYYDKAIGRWNRQDDYRGEMSVPASLHRYQYVFNNPVNYSDPSGYAGNTVDFLLDLRLQAIVWFTMLKVIIGFFSKKVIGLPITVNIVLLVSWFAIYLKGAISYAEDAPSQNTRRSIALAIKWGVEAIMLSLFASTILVSVMGQAAPPFAATVWYMYLWAFWLGASILFETYIRAETGYFSNKEIPQGRCEIV